MIMGRPYLICESDKNFILPDPETPIYAFGEIDVYAFDPTQITQGRVSIRHNLIENVWELYRQMHCGRRFVTILARGTLQEVCNAANTVWARARGGAKGFGEEGPNFRPCDHGDQRSRRCGGF